MFRVQVQNSIHDRPVIGDADDWESAKVLAEQYANVNELIWNVTDENTLWSDEVDGGRKLGVIFYIFRLVDNA